MFLLLWLFAIPIALADQVVMTILVRREYRTHRSLWEDDGKPRGIFWIPEESMIGGWYVTYSSIHALHSLSWDWFFSTPQWIAKDNHNHLLLLLHRVLMPVVWICIAAPFVIALLL